MSVEVDFSFGWGPEARFRGNAFHQRGSLGLALRLIPRAIPTFARARTPAGHRATGRRAAGSGAGHRSDRVGEVDDARLDDPSRQHPAGVSRAHDRGPDRVLPRPRPLGRDPARDRHGQRRRFPGRCARRLREDPDVLLVGEMRDLESIETTLTIAETGHLVFATLHTNDAAQAIDRVIDVFPGERQSQIRSQLVGLHARRGRPAAPSPRRRRADRRVRGAAEHARGAQPHP